MLRAGLMVSSPNNVAADRLLQSGFFELEVQQLFSRHSRKEICHQNFFLRTQQGAKERKRKKERESERDKVGGVGTSGD